MYIDYNEDPTTLGKVESLLLSSLLFIYSMSKEIRALGANRSRI